MNLTEAIDWATAQLAAKQIEDARLEAELILVYALSMKRSELILNQSLTIEDKNFQRFKGLIGRRLKHEPTAYIIGNQPFILLDITVNRSVLIPRPETELLVEHILRVISPPAGEAGRQSSVTIADIGTGSGCIAVTLAKRLPQAKIIGTDISSDALKVAKSNAELLNVADRCQFIKGNLLEPLKEPVDLIVANLPYIPSGEINKLQPEVKDWEPRQALDGGKDGLDYIRKLLKESPKYLKPGGRLFMEFGFGQAEKVTSLARECFREIEITNDYAGIARILTGV